MKDHWFDGDNDLIKVILFNLSYCRDHRLTYDSKATQKKNWIIRFDDNTISCSLTKYPLDLTRNFSTQPLGTIHYFTDDKDMTKGSIYSFLHDLILDDDGLLFSVLMNQLLSTYQQEPKKSLLSYLPECITDLIIDGLIESEYRQLLNICYTAILLYNFKDIKPYDTLFDYISDKLEPVSTHPIEIYQFEQLDYHAPTSTLSKEEMVRLLLRFGEMDESFTMKVLQHLEKFPEDS